MRGLLEGLSRSWYRSGHPLGIALAPIGWLFALATTLRRAAYASRLLGAQRLPVPVVVVGNLTVGGTGKTPLVLWLADFLLRHGYRPGIVTRGYGAQRAGALRTVSAASDAGEVGDEPLLLAERSGCPVVAAPDRVAAGRRLLAEHDCDLLLCDDGLQHLRLARDVEIVVIDGVRRFGNGRCLPAGPLREPPRRLRTADLVVVNGGAAGTGEVAMRLEPGALRPVRREQPHAAPLTLADLAGRRVRAVAGIGNPRRFFDMLEAHGIEVLAHAFPDHHRFVAADLAFDDGLPLLMTEKDAVKCRAFAPAGARSVPVDAVLPATFGEGLLHLLHRSPDGPQAS